MLTIYGGTMPDESTLTVRLNLKIPTHKRIWDWSKGGNRSERIRSVLLAHIMGQQGDVTNQLLLTEIQQLKELIRQASISPVEGPIGKQPGVDNPRAMDALRKLADNG